MKQITKNITGAEVLITGGAGFVGSNLAEKLVERGAKVTILDAMISPYGGNRFNIKNIARKITFVEGDIRSSSTVKKVVSGKDFIFHLAGQTGRTISMEKPLFDTKINSYGTLVILDAIRKQKKKPKIIFASTRGVVGKPEYLPVDEKHPEKPLDVYAMNKLAAENYCLLLGKQYSFGATALRFNNIYGPKCQVKSNHYGTINLFISYALQGKVMPIYGDGKQTRDYLYVDDAVEAFITAMEPAANGNFYFVGTGKSASLLNIVKIIEKHIPTAKHMLVPFPQLLQNIDFADFYSTSKKITGELGWKPKVTLKDGIAETVNYYKKYHKYYL